MWIASARNVTTLARAQALNLQKSVRAELAQYFWRTRKRWRRHRESRLRYLCAKLRLSTAVEAEKIYQAHLRQAARDCTEIALRVAAEILETEISINSDGVRTRVGTLLDELRCSTRRVLLVNPIDYEQLRAQSQSQLYDCELAVEPKLERGCAILQLPAGTIKIDPYLTLEQVREDTLRKFSPELERLDRTNSP